MHSSMQYFHKVTYLLNYLLFSLLQITYLNSPTLLSGTDLRDTCNILEIPLGMPYDGKGVWIRRRSMQRKEETVLQDFISGQWRRTSVARTSTQSFISKKCCKAFPMQTSLFNWYKKNKAGETHSDPSLCTTRTFNLYVHTVQINWPVTI